MPDVADSGIFSDGAVLETRSRLRGPATTHSLTDRRRSVRVQLSASDLTVQSSRKGALERRRIEQESE